MRQEKECRASNYRYLTMWSELAVSYGDIESVRGFKGTGFEVPVDNRSRSVSPAWLKPRLQHIRVDIGIGIEKYLGCHHKLMYQRRFR